MRVDGMTCAMCAKTITNTFENYEDINAKVNVGAGKVLFSYDEEKYSKKKKKKFLDWLTM